MAKVTVRIESLRREIDHWRAGKRKAGGRVPERFWKAAVELASAVGPERVCRELGLSEAQLRKRFRPQAALKPMMPTFVEMLMESPIQKDRDSQLCSGCTIKVEAVSGARMLVEVAELKASGLATLLREFVS